MAEQKQDKDKSVLTDKEKFEQHPGKEEIAHMGDKPRQTPAPEQAPKK